MRALRSSSVGCKPCDAGTDNATTPHLASGLTHPLRPWRSCWPHTGLAGKSSRSTGFARQARTPLWQQETSGANNAARDFSSKTTPRKTHFFSPCRRYPTQRLTGRDRFARSPRRHMASRCGSVMRRTLCPSSTRRCPAVKHHVHLVHRRSLYVGRGYHRHCAAVSNSVSCCCTRRGKCSAAASATGSPCIH